VSVCLSVCPTHDADVSEIQMGTAVCMPAYFMTGPHYYRFTSLHHKLPLLRAREPCVHKNNLTGCLSGCCTAVADVAVASVIVWRLGGRIIGTVLCCIMYDKRTIVFVHNDTHTHARTFLKF